ncbi:hypothetical protein [Pedobacter lusitanus]|uniref:hypothetical protein n=1 Tax=Pedobacter lusitanus TaxID=1503925 RepID=UPI000697E817|nr:hypothetical protein [Pedobacter lusitanus]
MIKKIIALSIGGLCFCLQGFGQETGDFSQVTVKVGELIKGYGADGYYGWGLNKNKAFDIRPNSPDQSPYVINHHTGLTFSAHSVYGGIRFYNQAYPGLPLDPANGATMVMSITNNAVGIGTTNPRVLLDVGGDVSNGKLGAVLGRLPEGDSEGDGTFVGLRGFTTNASNKSFALEHSFYGKVNSSINFFRGDGKDGGFIAFNTMNNAERVRIDAYGNVGIATVKPIALLDIGTDISNGKLGAVFGHLPEGNLEGEGTFLGVRGTSTSTVGGKSFALEHSFYGKVNSSINFFRGGDKIGGFIALNTGNNIEQVRIDASGNVGIGTTTPTAKLSVNGNLWATEIRVDSTNPWPDYVFEPYYEKLPLTELESFIKINKHLPEIPSAGTIAKEGIDLGDMNAKLLKKVEELTLYLIELKKDNEVLSERVKKLENKN